MELTTSFSIELLSKALDGHAKRHLAITSNLANVDTPAYKRLDVTFEQHLSQAVQHHQSATQSSEQRVQGGGSAYPYATGIETELRLRTIYPEHYHAEGGAAVNLAEFEPQMEQANQFSYRNDENSVDIEQEMVQLAKNTERYAALSNMESKLFSGIRTVIKEAGSI